MSGKKKIAKKSARIVVAMYDNIDDIAYDFKDRKKDLISVGAKEIYGKMVIQAYYWKKQGEE